MRQIIVLLSFTLATAVMAGCSGSDGNNTDSANNTSSSNPAGLSDFEMKHGIGPVDEKVELGELNEEMAEKGQQVFKSKCSACHKVGERYVGPDLDNILKDRTPTYVMNMILNPDEMVKKHPEAKKKLAEFMTPMPFQNVDRQQARAIVEYLRTAEPSN